MGIENNQKPDIAEIVHLIDENRRKVMFDPVLRQNLFEEKIGKLNKIADGQTEAAKKLRGTIIF